MLLNGKVCVREINIKEFKYGNCLIPLDRERSVLCIQFQFCSGSPRSHHHRMLKLKM